MSNAVATSVTPAASLTDAKQVSLLTLQRFLSEFPGHSGTARYFTVVLERISCKQLILFAYNAKLECHSSGFLPGNIIIHEVLPYLVAISRRRTILPIYKTYANILLYCNIIDKGSLSIRIISQ